LSAPGKPGKIQSKKTRIVRQIVFSNKAFPHVVSLLSFALLSHFLARKIVKTVTCNQSKVKSEQNSPSSSAELAPPSSLGRCSTPEE